MSRNSRMFTTQNGFNVKLVRSTWVEIHVCLQQICCKMKKHDGSTWVEIHVCLQRYVASHPTALRSTWVEIHVCLQQCSFIYIRS